MLSYKVNFLPRINWIFLILFFIEKHQSRNQLISNCVSRNISSLKLFSTLSTMTKNFHKSNKTIFLIFTIYNHKSFTQNPLTSWNIYTGSPLSLAMAKMQMNKLTAFFFSTKTQLFSLQGSFINLGKFLDIAHC